MKRMNDTNQRKQQILQTAEKMFCQYGYQKTSVEKIAASCGLVKGTVLHYFGSKDKLYQSVLQTRRNQTVDYLEKALIQQEKSVQEILQTALGICKEQLSSNSAFAKEYAENPASRQSFNEMRIPVYEGLAALFEKLIQRGIDNKELTVENPKLRAYAVAFAIFGITNSENDPDNMCAEIREVLEAMLGLEFD